MKTLLTLLMTAALLICTSSKTSAQMVSISRVKTGLLISGSAAGNGLTGNFSAGVYRTNKSNTIALEVIVPKNLKYISGAQMTFNRKLLKHSDSYTGFIGMYWFVAARYNHQTELSKTSVKVLEKISPEFTQAASTRYRTAEGYTGIGLTAKITKSLLLFTDLGAGYFCTLEKNRITPVVFTTYKSDCDFALFSKAGLRFKIKG